MCEVGSENDQRGVRGSGGIEVQRDLNQLLEDGSEMRVQDGEGLRVSGIPSMVIHSCS